MTEETGLNSVELATELTVAWLSNQNNRVSADDVPNFLRTMHATLNELSGDTDPASSSDEPATEYTPAVTVRKSLSSPDHIISMIDGKPYKTLRRHLSTNGLTAEEYRERYNLKPDYPMVAPTYSEARRVMAKQIGLGNKGRGGNKRTPSAGSNAEKAAPAKMKRTPKAPSPT